MNNGKFQIFIMIHTELKYTEEAIFVVTVNRHTLHLSSAHVGEETDMLIKWQGMAHSKGICGKFL